MASLNKVFLIGNLTREPALRFTPGGSAVCEFGLAINRRFTVNGQDKEETCFVDIVVWGKQAENCNRFLTKGASTFIEGRLQLDQWDDKETGAKRSRLRVIAERVQFMSRSEKAGAGGDYPDQMMDAEVEEMPSQSRPQREQYQQAPRQQPQRPPQQQQQQYSSGAQQQQYSNNDYNNRKQAPPPMPKEAFNEEPEDDIPF